MARSILPVLFSRPPDAVAPRILSTTKQTGPTLPINESHWPAGSASASREDRTASGWPTGQSRWHRSALCSFWQWLFATRRPTLPRTILSSSSRSLIVKRLSVSRLCPIVGLLLPPLHTCARLGLVIPYNTRHLSTTNEPHEHQVSNRECDSRPP